MIAPSSVLGLGSIPAHADQRGRALESSPAAVARSRRAAPPGRLVAKGRGSVLRCPGVSAANPSCGFSVGGSQA